MPIPGTIDMSMSTEVLNIGQLLKLKVPDLKALCRQRGLALSGTKAILIDRLLSHSAGTSPGASSGSPTSSTTALQHFDQPIHTPPPLPNNNNTPSTFSPAAGLTVTHDTLDAPVSPGPDAPTCISADIRASPAKSADKSPSKTAHLPSPLGRPAPTRRISSVSVAAPLALRVSRSNFQALRPSRPLPPVDLSRASFSTTAVVTVQVPVTVSQLTARFTWLLKFLGQTTFHAFVPSDSSPDCLQALASYLLTRVYYLLGQGESGSDSVSPLPSIGKISSVDTIAPGIYRCRFLDDTEHVFIGATGEIISSDGSLRPDWSGLLKRYSDGMAKKEELNLIGLVRNQDEESFDKGVSKAFRNKLAAMEDRTLASELLAIAESYVLAHVSPNAISGTWLSVHRQCADFQGLAQSGEALSSLKPTAGFFLPEGHLVESVAITGLHEDLAIVQTTHRAHYVFRRTGQIVGEGDEGVFPLFQEILLCDQLGRTVTPE